MSTFLDINLLGPRGATLGGTTSSQDIGTVVSSVGDFNGDGFDDIIVATGGYTSGDGGRDRAYVVYGKADGLNAVDLANLRPSDGFAIRGGYATFSVSSAGDMNGDGFDDIVVGKSGGYYGGTPHAYIVFGHAGGGVSVDIEQFTPSDTFGFSINGNFSGNWSQFSVSAAGDVNGDGLADIVIGSPADNDFAGVAYVIFGKQSGLGTIDLSNVGTTTGFTIKGVLRGDGFGISVADAGDVNHDGFDDLVIGAPYAKLGGVQTGAAYVIFGKAGGFGTIDVANLTLTTGFVIQGDVQFDGAGASVAGAGDVNGDGYDDIIIGSPFHDDGGPEAGEAYVIFGRANGFSNIDLTNLGTAGFIIRGDSTNDLAGWSVAAAGDLNRDGFDDVIVGAPQDNGGAAYVIFGKSGGFGAIDLTDLAPATGLIIRGGASDEFLGGSVAGRGDVNGDGVPDLLIGARFADVGSANSGALHVVSGSGSLIDVRNDFNGDGRSDILWRGDNGTVFNWLANGKAGFASNAATFATVVPTDQQAAGTGDFNGDGISDILWRHDITGRLYNWLGTGNGGFIDNSANFSSSLPSNVHIVGIGDFNGDGRDDMLLRNDAGLLFDWLGQASGGFDNNTGNFSTVVSAEWRVLGTGDFNGDGRDDILWRQDGTGRLVDWLGTASGGFTTNNTNFDSAMSLNVAFAGTGDFNGDGRDDILWRGSDGRLFDWLGSFNGGFASNTSNFTTVMPTDWRVVSVGDFNADGRDDILWRQDGTGHLLDWLGIANGGFVTNAQNFDSSVPNSLHVQDPFL